METVAVCDTEPIAIKGLSSFLESVEDLRVVASDTSLPRVMELIHELKPSLFILGKAVGIQEVMNSLKDLRKSESPTRAIIWSSGVSSAESLRLVYAGASGVISKTAPLTTLLACMHEVASGKIWIEEQTSGKVNRRLRRADSSLTAREQQVLELVERGLTNRDIGAELGISTGTVKIHVKNIFEKTGVRGRHGLAFSALKAKGILGSSVAIR